MVTILSSVETDLRQAGVERGRLPRTGRTGHEHHAVRLVDELAKLPFGVVLEAEHVEVEGLELGVGGLLVEDPDHRVLAVHGRHDRDPEIDGAARESDLEAAVLGDSFLRDIELRHDLDAADDGRVVPLVDRLHRLIEDTVDAVLDHHLAVLGLDMDVRRAALDGVEENGVDETDDGRRVGGDAVDGEDLLPVLRLLHQLHAEALGRFVEYPLGGLRFLQDFGDPVCRGHRHLERPRERQLDLVEADHVGWVGHDHVQGLSVALQREELIPQHHLHRYGAEELGVDVKLVQWVKGQIEALGQRPSVLLLFLLLGLLVEHDELFFEVGVGSHGSLTQSGSRW